MPNVAEAIISALADLGVRSVWGVVGDALNPVTDAIRRDDRIEWIGTRHEEVAAFAAGAQAQLTGTLGVCMGTVGPGSIHLLNGLYDAKKSHAPVLAICGQVTLAALGSDTFQEVDNDHLFADVAEFRHTLTSPEQVVRVLEQAVHAALSTPGVAVISLPGDVGDLEMPTHSPPPRLAVTSRTSLPDPRLLRDAVETIDEAARVTLLVGIGARQARAEVLALAERLKAPVVLTLKAKEGLERENPYEIGQCGLLGNPATTAAFDASDVLIMVGTDFPYTDWLPSGATTIQIDDDPSHIGRRTSVDLGLVGDSAATLDALLERVVLKTDRSHLEAAREAYDGWRTRQRRLVTPGREAGVIARVRARFDNPDDRIRPEVVAALVDDAADDDAIFTTDTGMSTVWLARFVHMRGTRRLLGSFNLGSMANAMPQALGAQALDRRRQVVAFCGDGGLTMLLGDLLTAVAYDLAVTLIVFNNGSLGMVKLEQEQVGLPEFGTRLANPDLAAVARAMGLTGLRITDVADLAPAVRTAFATPGPVLLDVVTNAGEIALPPSATAGQAWGFAIAKVKETVLGRGDG